MFMPFDGEWQASTGLIREDNLEISFAENLRWEDWKEWCASRDPAENMRTSVGLLKIQPYGNRITVLACAQCNIMAGTTSWGEVTPFRYSMSSLFILQNLMVMFICSHEILLQCIIQG